MSLRKQQKALKELTKRKESKWYDLLTKLGITEYSNYCERSENIPLNPDEKRMAESKEFYFHSLKIVGSDFVFSMHPNFYKWRLTTHSVIRRKTKTGTGKILFVKESNSIEGIDIMHTLKSIGVCLSEGEPVTIGGNNPTFTLMCSNSKRVRPCNDELPTEPAEMDTIKYDFGCLMDGLKVGSQYPADDFVKGTAKNMADRIRCEIVNAIHARLYKYGMRSSDYIISTPKVEGGNFNDAPKYGQLKYNK